MDEKVLLVEDDDAIRRITARALENSGFRVITQSDGRSAIRSFANERFDIVILDLMLPSLDGIHVCRHIRQRSQVPLIMLTARTETSDIIMGLEVGADDYVTKPFEHTELVARIRALLRRVDLQQSNEDLVAAGPFEIDRAGFKAYKSGELVDLSATEFRLLDELSRNAGRVLSREALLGTVWGYDYLGDSRLVDMAVKRLRAKVEDDPSEPKLIQTVRGIGYRLEK